MPKPPVFLRPRFLFVASCLHLALPFAIFVTFWVKWQYALPIVILLLYCLTVAFRDVDPTPAIDRADSRAVHRNWFIGAGILFLWLLFSGIGNLAYQNSDFDIRNAVLRDLVQRPWPVTYAPTIYGPERQFTQNPLLLVYYFGYWLPAALVGKVAGLTAANLFLFIWTFLGLLLIYSSMSQVLKKVNYKTVVLLIVWSGLDVIGTLWARLATAGYVELNPLTHLERWVNYFGVYAQFSSITTLLYWVFNQTIPLWLVVSLFLGNRQPRSIYLLIALSFFLAPIGTLGFIPFVMFRLGQQIRQQGFIPVLQRYLSLGNTVGVLCVLGVALSFFTTNRAGALKAIVFFDWLPYSTFLLLEAGLLTVLLFIFYRSRLALVCFGMLCLLPLVKVGRFYDFGMRASIAYLFILCLLTIQFLLDKQANKTGKLLVVAYVLIGSVTPLLEITRSVFFTSSHVLYLTSETLKARGLGTLMPARLQGVIKDRDFLYDRVRTFSRYNKDLDPILDQFVGASEGNLFADYLLRRPTVSSDQLPAKKRDR